MTGLLVAEDELIERMVLGKLLTKKFGEKCRIFEAQNGNEALELFAREKIGAAVLDIGMPGLDGIQTAEAIHREKPQCGIIFLTAYDRFDYARRAVSIGALDYLLKPYSTGEIVSAVGEALRLADALEDWEENGNPDVPQEKRLRLLRNESRREQEEEETDTGDMDSKEESARLSVMVSMVEEYMKKHYMENISMRDAAEAVNYSEPYFCKMFKKQYGKSFTACLTEYRMREAKKLLWKPDVNVKEVGARVGYPDPNYFTKVFRRVTGMTPSDYRTDVLRKM